MGCGASKSNYSRPVVAGVRPGEKDRPRTPLTEEMKLEVSETWQLVAQDMERHGVAFFKRIFELAPEALQLFSFKDEANLYESHSLKVHATKVMTTVGVAVAGLTDLEKLVPVLKALGERHKARGVLPAHYDVVGAALLYTLEHGLGDRWSDNVRTAWSSVYTLVSTTMIEGAGY